MVVNIILIVGAIVLFVVVSKRWKKAKENKPQ